MAYLVLELLEAGLTAEDIIIVVSILYILLVSSFSYLLAHGGEGAVTMTNTVVT